MSDARLIAVVKTLRALDIEDIRRAIDDDAERAKLLQQAGVTEQEFLDYLAQEVTFEIDGVSIKRERRRVIQAMHSCC